jgi:hypothetical protein
LSEEDDTYSTMFNALKHPIRRKILRIINESPVTYTEILSQLGIDNGLLNYHLENMKDLIAKREDGGYLLSEFGKAAVGLTQKVEESPRKAETSPKGLFSKQLKGITLILLVGAVSLSYLYLTQSAELNQKNIALDAANNKLVKLSILGELSNITTSTQLTGGVQIVNKFPMTYTYLNQSEGNHPHIFGESYIMIYVPVEGSVVDLNLFVEPVNLYELDLTLQRGNAWRNETWVRQDVPGFEGISTWLSPIVWEVKTMGNGVYETTPLSKGWYTLSFFGPIVHGETRINTTVAYYKSPWFASPYYVGAPIDYYDAFLKVEVRKDGRLTFFNVSTEQS